MLAVALRVLPCAYYACLTAMALLAFLVPSLRREVIAYGKLAVPKTRSASALKQRSPLAQLLLASVSETVPKRWFLHFYALGFAWSSLLLGVRTLYYNRVATVAGMHGIEWTPTAWLPLLFHAQMTRRLGESLFVERHAVHSRMLLGHYLIGLSFYLVTGIVVAVRPRGAITLPPIHPGALSLGILLFVIGSLGQYQCHRHLATLREQHGHDRYLPPRGSWFSYTYSPHYVFEVLIYASFCVVAQLQVVSLHYCLLWVVVNLGILALETRRWYRASEESKEQ